MPVDRILHRDMSEQAIALSFKGILRIAAVLDLQSEYEDKMLNPIYYGSPEGLVSAQSQSEDRFSKYKDYARYTFDEDAYKNKKFPVTDSLGYYLNFNVGEDSTTIGSDELNNGLDASTTSFTQVLAPGTFTQSRVFPVINSECVVVGREERVMPEVKNAELRVTGGAVNIDSSPYFDSIKARLVTNNIFDHSPNNINTDGNYNTVTDGYKRRTVIQDTNPDIRNYDALVHYQDNIDWNNYKNNKTIDSIIDVVNLKDYVKEKLQKWLGNNSLEVPTGQINWQYINLKKWYNYGTSTTISDTESWLGHYPPMGYMYDTNSYTPSLYQGVVRPGLNHLAAMTQVLDEETGEMVDKQLKEIIPLYKRDYVLCDGQLYAIYLHTPRTFDRYNLISYDMFINLFFAIGYEYTDYEHIAPHRKNVKNGTKYTWQKLGEGYAQRDTKIDKDVLFGIDLLTMLAFKKLQAEIDSGSTTCTDTKGNYDRNKAENWLKNQKLPAEYVFNTPIPYNKNDSSGNDGILYEYTPAKVTAATPTTYMFDIGREVENFSSLVRYYDDTTNQYVNVQAYLTAEVQYILDLFTNVALQRDKLLTAYNAYYFQVPNFMQAEDDKYETGVFIGSSPYYWWPENKGKYEAFSYSAFSDASVPHRHVIFWGPKVFYGLDSNREPYRTPMGEVTQSSMARAENAVSFMDALPNGSSQSANVYSYSFAEVAGTYYNKQMIGGIASYVIQMKDGNTNITYPNHPDPRWRDAEPNRGATSEMVLVNSNGEANTLHDEKYLQSQKLNPGGMVEYFTPESVSLVPLIKI